MSDTTVYTLYPEVGADERGRYFDGQFLTAQDFVDEQRYHVDRLRRTLDLLTVSGVAEGLELAAAGPWRVALGPGTAIDGHGRLLVVPVRRDSLDVPRDIPDGVADVALYYAEAESRVYGGTSEEDGTRGATRTRELPTLEFHAPGAAPTRPGAVPLARLRVAPDGAVTVDNPNPVRRFSGVRLPSAGADAPTLRSGGPARPKLLQVTGDLHVSGRLGVGTLDPESELDVRGLLRVDRLSIREKTLRVGGDEATFYPVVFRDLDWSAGAAVLEISRANAQADAQSAGSLIARLRWHAGDGHGSELLDCEIVQSRRFVAAARPLRQDRLLVVWLRGARTYAWRANHRVEVADENAAGKTLGGEALAQRADVDPAFDRDRVRLGPAIDRTVVRGDLEVTSRLVRLDVADNTSATIRAYDLFLGHPTRRGSPGRALVDMTGTLVVNFDRDWPNLRLDGSLTTVTGDFKANRALTVDGAATLNNGAVVAGNLSCTGTLTSDGQATLRSGAAVTGSLSCTGTLTSDGRATLRSGLDVTGDLTYTGAISRLDVGEQERATVRAIRLDFGHSTRRGSPGRLAVDEGSGNLVINWGPDWPTLNLGGQSVISHGTLTVKRDLVVQGNSRLTGTLTVDRDDGHICLWRGRGTTGGAKLFLELVQDDVPERVVPEVGLSIRFIHHNRFMSRIEARPGAFFLRSGDLGSNDLVNLVANEVQGAKVLSGGRDAAVGMVERLKIVRGSVDASGNVAFGRGFKCEKQGRLWKVTFDTAFAEVPTVVACQHHPDKNDMNLQDGGSNTRDNAVVVSVSEGAFLVKTGDGDGDHSWRRFEFIAVGP